MGAINKKDFLDELIFCLKEEDLVKAKALLQFASDSNVDENVQHQALIELAKGPEKMVLPLLDYLTKIEISNPKVREYLYDLILDNAYGNTDLVIEYITQNEKNARLLFLKAAGDLILTDTAPALATIIQKDPDTDIVLAAVKALGALRRADSLDIFAGLARNPDPDIRRAAIFAISETGGQDAVDRLIAFIGEDEQINKFAVEALGEAQDLYALEKLTTLLGSPITNVRDTAIDQLMKLGQKATPILTQAFKNAKADYLVHLVTTLGYIGDPAAISPIVDIINTQPEDANIRQAAYEAMERIPSPKTAISLVQGLQDPVEAVRMSAARAIDKNLSKALVAGLKNVVREESPEARQAVGALIDSDASNIFNFLVEEDHFLELAETHMVSGADPETRKAFLHQMNSLGRKEFSAKVSDRMNAGDTPAEKTEQIFVIDDSKMMLKLYRNKLTALGFTPQTFDRPEDAIPEILEKRPDLVITDLNMPNISGLELSREIRKKFTPKDMPILMITTQSDFVEKKDGDIRVDDSMLIQSGINKVLHKPFTDDAFRDAIARFLTP